MAPATRYRDYDAFAWFYNQYWCVEIPRQMLSVLDILLLPHLPAGARLLDLCCGTGQLAGALVERGFKVLGLDGSGAMLSYARRNAAGAEFVLADARQFRLSAVHHGAISVFDSLNHVLHLEELAELFRHVHDALIRGGLFLFDLNMEKGFQLHWRDYFSIVESDHVCLMRGTYEPHEGLARYDMTLFRLHEEGWRRADASIIERCYDETQIRRALGEAGFYEISTYDAEQDLGLEDHVGRRFFRARKG